MDNDGGGGLPDGFNEPPDVAQQVVSMGPVRFSCAVHDCVYSNG